MILTIAWKECREHWPIWFTMVFMTTVLAFGVAQLSDTRDSEATLGLTVLAMAATYGLVCGAMMLAGEREGGTLVLLDIFLGRRGLLWVHKFPVGLALALTEGLVVAAALYFLKLMPPHWLPALIGHGREGPIDLGWGHGGPSDTTVWFVALPALTVEAYAWGLLGSSLTKRVITGAVIAAFMAVPLWFLFLCTPPFIFLSVRLVAVSVVLIVSVATFVSQTRDGEAAGTPPEREPQKLDRWIDEWNASDQVRWERGRGWEKPTAKEVAVPAEEIPIPVVRTIEFARHPLMEKRIAQSEDPRESLLWLTLRQSPILLGVLGVFCFFFGLLIPVHGQVLWPVATLLLGIACGTATFAWEQTDLSYQFLAAQHFPLKTVWNVKVLYWLGSALLGSIIVLIGGVVVILVQGARPAGPGLDQLRGFDFGSLYEILGWPLFFTIWLAYGFCVAPVFVFTCRKMILAVLLSAMASFAAIGLWLPSLLCLGMSGWQLWVTPLAMLLASRIAMRAWAGGRIKDRGPLSKLIYGGVACFGFALLCFAYRAFELPSGTEPLDRNAFRALMPAGDANAGAQKIQDALSDLTDAQGNEGEWQLRMIEAAKLPMGTLEGLPADGQDPVLRHLPDARRLTSKLRTAAIVKRTRNEPDKEFEHLAQLLLLSRTLRNKAPIESYLIGVESERVALTELEQLLAQSRPNAALLKRIREELNRHAAETPSARDCLETECYRSGGMLLFPTSWSFFAGPTGRITENWLAGGVAFSLDVPWEAERRDRLWRAVWAGLFRTIDSPHWNLRETSPDIATRLQSTKTILDSWSTSVDGSNSTHSLARTLDASWLSDERLFAKVLPLHAGATHSLWRVSDARLTVALVLYQAEEKKVAAKLSDLVPKYLRELPVDPYSGQPFRYRVSAGEVVRFARPVDEFAINVAAGQGVLWSTGPDRIDNGGRRAANNVIDQDLQMIGRESDLVTVVPARPLD